MRIRVAAWEAAKDPSAAANLHLVSVNTCKNTLSHCLCSNHSKIIYLLVIKKKRVAAVWLEANKTMWRGSTCVECV